MVIKIHQTASTKDAFNYNEKKVMEGHAQFFHSKNTTELRPFAYPSSQRLEQLVAIEKSNKRCQNKCFHVSVNPTNEELVKLTKERFKKEIDAFMQHLGYGHQPYFVYEHADLKRTHFHIVSTRIDAQNRKKINDSNEKRKVNQFIKELQQRYQFDETKMKLDKINLIPTINSMNLHESIHQVFKLLNQSNIDNWQEYLDILKAFNLELYQSGKGQSVIVKDSHGQVLRHPIALSQFREPPNLPVCETQELNKKINEELKIKVERILKELNQTYRFYTIEELQKGFIQHNLLPYTLSKNGNLNIYSPLDNIVVDAQVLLKRHRMRLQGFVLSNDLFYAIIRESTQQNKLNIFVDKENSTLALKDLNLEACCTLKQIVPHLNSEQQELVKKAVEAHLVYIANKVLKQSQLSLDYNQKRQGRSCWDKLNHQFIIEVLNYQNWMEPKNKKLQKKNGSKRRKSRRF